MYNVASLSQAHKRFINRDAGNPGCEACASLKLMEITMSFEHSFLLCVLRVFLIARNAEGQTEGALLAILKHLRAHDRFAFFANACGAWTIHSSPRLRKISGTAPVLACVSAEFIVNTPHSNRTP